MTSGSICPEESCPACNRFIGTHLTCPYCDEDTPRRSVYRCLRHTALTLSFTGLGLLLLLAARAAPPVISLSAIRPAMNHGYVTLSGPADVTGHLYLVAGKPHRLYPDGSHKALTP